MGGKLGLGDGEIVWVVEGCGAMCEENGTKTGEENGRKLGRIPPPPPPFFFSKSSFGDPHFPHPEVEDLPHSSLCKNQLTAFTDGEIQIFATHRLPPPRRRVRLLAPADLSTTRPSWPYFRWQLLVDFCLGGYDLDYERDIELKRERIRNRAAKQTEVMHSSAWHKCIFILYAIPG